MTITIKYCTLQDSHRTGTTEIVQAIKSVEENIEDSKKNENMGVNNVQIKKMVSKYASE